MWSKNIINHVTKTIERKLPQKPIDPSLSISIGKSEFKNKNLVSSLKNEKIVKQVGSDPYFVIFNKKIKSELQLRKQLEKKGINEIDNVLNIWQQTRFIYNETLPQMGQSIEKFLLNSSSTQNPCGNRVVILAPPGGGKTVLLARLIDWMQKEHNLQPKHAKELTPIGLFLTPGDIKNLDNLDVESLRGFLNDSIERFEKENNSEKCPIKHPGLLEPYGFAGLVYLMFDGLDELAIRDSGKAKKIMLALNNITEEDGVSVYITCRKNIWKHHIQNTQNYQIVEILPFNSKQAIEFLDGVPLPDTAKDNNGNPKKWLRNPLILTIVKKIFEEYINIDKSISYDSHPTTIDENNKFKAAFDSRSNLYESWAQYIAQKAGKRHQVNPESLLTFFCDIAFTLLENRNYSIKLLDLTEFMPTTFIGKKLQSKNLDDMEVLVRTDENNQEFRFFHESVYEFFAIRNLIKEFKKFINYPYEEIDFKNLKLASAELDYLQSIAYGFLSESLGREFACVLKKCLNRPEIRKIKEWQVLRNMIEYIGMTYCEGNDHGLVMCLLSLMEEENLELRVRYNAARAIERIHPQAPRPYFNYVSDWGENYNSNMGKRNWTEIYKEAKGKKDNPYVMKGSGRPDPVPGRHWAFVDNIHDITVDLVLQKELSKKIGQLLEKLLNLKSPEEYSEEDSTPKLSHLILNCSHAWIRWFHKDHNGQCITLINSAKEKIAEENNTIEKDIIVKIIYNLEYWVLRKRKHPKASNFN